MSWGNDQDYCGLAIDHDAVEGGQAADHSLPVKSATKGVSSTFKEWHRRIGDYAKQKGFGVRAAPRNAYTVAGEVTVSDKALGTVNTVEGEKFALESIKFSTGADAEPTFEAGAKQVAPDGVTRNTFPVPAFKLSPDHVAQIPEFKWTSNGEFVPAFSLPTGTPQASKNAAVELTGVQTEISCAVKTNDKNGDPKAHDVTNGHIVVQVTLAQYGAQEPEVVAADGWEVSAAPTPDGQDSDFPTWTLSLTHPLVKQMQS